jgi:hypothetical protein
MVGRRIALSLLLMVFSVAIFLATGEIGLRMIYRDAGTRTLGGPGGHGFEHLTVYDDQRGRFDYGATNPQKPRILILGDSITWGQGVREWQEVWPEQLARALEHAGMPHEMAVLAMPGRDIPAHVQQMAEWAATIKPDIFIYQWYINDIEVNAERPHNQRWWQQWSGHERLRRSSYLYYFLDNRLSTYLPPPDRSYVQYILEDFAPGSLEWSEFERLFHTLAMRAAASAPLRMIVIYPQVPYRGTSPLKPIHDRVIALAGPHRFSIPPAAWIRFAGTPVARADAPWHQAVDVSAATQGPVLETRAFYMPPTPFDVVLTMSTRRPSDGATSTPAAAPFGSLELIDQLTNAVLSTTTLAPLPDHEGWQEITAKMSGAQTGRDVRLRLTATGKAPFAAAAIEIPVDYAFKVVDLTETLNNFNTHTSIFDAHPNTRAHKVIAEKVFEAVRDAESRH